MGLLADVFSYGDGLKRRLGGLLSDPVGTVGLGARRFNEDQDALQRQALDAGFLPGSRSVLQRPQDVEQARKQFAEKAMDAYGGLLGATVWHGSPHKFDKFDSSKIGTGEGAQAYGHGIYTAQAKEVADQYRINLSYDPAQMKVGGKQINDYYTQIQNRAARMPPNAAASEYEKLDLLERLMSNEAADDVANYASGMSKATQDWFAKQVKPQFQSYGHLYKVDLPDEHIAKMLDWDKPLSQQAPGVKAALRQAGISTDEKALSSFDDALFDALNGGPTALPKQPPNPAGETVYRKLGGPDAAAKRLRDLGIPGIRYLDGGSRGAGGGTSNYVVFPGNENLLKILERNGQPLP